MNWAVAFSGLIGAITGGAVSLLTTRLTLRHQAEVEKQKRADERHRAALQRAREAIAVLMRVSPRSDHHMEYQYDRGACR
jgi:uncharacterized membrane protein YdjX (TVP38/TMEM64 family)